MSTQLKISDNKQNEPTLLQTEKRLVCGYRKFVKNHISPCTPLGAMHTPFNSTSSKTSRQSLYRFLKNQVISIEKLSEALRPTARDNIRHYADKHILVAHDWSKIALDHKNKHDTYTLSHQYDRGYELQSSLAINAADGQPLAVLAQNLVTKDTVYSSYNNSAKMSHLDELGLRMKHIAEQNYLTEKQSFIHVIDREADSVYHLREWDAAGHQFLVRIRGCSGVTCDGKAYKAEELARELTYSFYKNVHHQDKQIAIEIAQTEAVLTRKSNSKRGKGRNNPLKVKIICVRLRTTEKMIEPWIVLTNADITAQEAAQYYYYRWRIESYFKLLKSAGYRVESWQQETGERICKRLLIVAQSCLLVWRLQSEKSEESQRFCHFLMRLSGRQTKKGREITAPALLEGILRLLSAQELLEVMTPEEIREAARRIQGGDM